MKHARGLSWISISGAIAMLAAMSHSAHAQSICGAAAGNLIANCGFESGPVAAGSLGFTSAYAYQSDLTPAGTFYIGSNPSAFNPFFPAFQNGTRLPLPNSGNDQMIINGASSPVKVWEESALPVSSNTNYYFSVFVQSVTDISPPILDFSANGVQLGSTFSSSTTTGLEQQFVATWFSGSSTTADLALVDTNTQASGNDFALDDFIFSTTAPGGGTGVGGTGTGGTSVPEPSSLALFGVGMLATLAWGRRARG